MELYSNPIKNYITNNNKEQKYFLDLVMFIKHQKIKNHQILDKERCKNNKKTKTLIV